MVKTPPKSVQETDAVTIHDEKMQRGQVGELHQFAEGDTPIMTTAQGGPGADDQNSLRIGARGPGLPQL